MNIDKIKLPKGKDRRVKLTDEQREQVRELHKKGKSKRALALFFGVSRRLVDFIVRPEKYELAKRQFRERRKDGRYKPEKHDWADVMREHRAYKKSVILKK